MNDSPSEEDCLREALLKALDELAELHKSMRFLETRLKAVKRKLSQAFNRSLQSAAGRQRRRSKLSPETLKALKAVVRPVPLILIQRVVGGKGHVTITDGVQTELGLFT